MTQTIHTPGFHQIDVARLQRAKTVGWGKTTGHLVTTKETTTCDVSETLQGFRTHFEKIWKFGKYPLKYSLYLSILNLECAFNFETVKKGDFRTIQQNRTLRSKLLVLFCILLIPFTFHTHNCSFTKSIVWVTYLYGPLWRRSISFLSQSISA